MKIISLFTATTLAGGLFAMEYEPKSSTEQVKMEKGQHAIAEEKAIKELQREIQALKQQLELLVEQHDKIFESETSEFTAEQEKEIQKLHDKIVDLFDQIILLWEREAEILHPKNK